MKRLAVIGIVLSLVFLATFGVGVALGWLQTDALTAWLEAQLAVPHGRWVIAAAVIGLLAADIVLGVPATPLLIAAGHLIGPWWGGLAGAVGATAAGVIGYAACRALGRPFFDRHIKQTDAARVQRFVSRYGLLAMVLIRGLPILPEVAACLAGLSRVSAWRFLVVFALVTVPWALLHAWAGHHSSLQQPWLALGVLVGLPAVAWAVGWRVWCHRA